MELITTKEIIQRFGISKRTWEYIQKDLQFPVYGWEKQNNFNRAEIQEFFSLSKQERKARRNKKQ